MDKDYVLNNLELAVKLLEQYEYDREYDFFEDELNKEGEIDIPNITIRNHCLNWKQEESDPDAEELDHPWVDYESF